MNPHEINDLYHHVSFLSLPQIDGYEPATKAIRFGDLTMADIDKVNAGEGTVPAENPTIPSDPAPYLHEILDTAKRMVPLNFMNMSEEDRKTRIKDIFTTRSFYAKDLIGKNENGSINYDQIIGHIRFLEEFRKELAAEHQAYDLVRRKIIETANAALRAEIAEKDKKYKPLARTEENREKQPRKTELEKKIEKLVKIGLSREAAEKILLGK